MAKIRRIYNPLDIAVTISAIESSLRQDYDVNYKRFTPDRRLVPTVVQPIVTLRDSAGLVDDGVINSKLIPESIKYYRTYYDAVLGKSVRKEITNDINYTIDTTSNSDNRGRITIRQNFIQENTTTITFQATYIDYVNVGGTNKERRRASVSESFTLTTDTLSQPEPLLIVDTPIGISYNPLKDLKWLNMVADLRVGQESIPSAYWWYKKDGAVETLLGEKYVGHNKRDIRIPSYEIGNKQDYVVKVQDCRNELEQLKNEYIDTEIAKNTITTSDGDIVLNNLVVNGGFESGVPSWSGTVPVLSEEEKLSGDSSGYANAVNNVSYSGIDIVCDLNDKLYISVSRRFKSVEVLSAQDIRISNFGSLANPTSLAQFYNGNLDVWETTTLIVNGRANGVRLGVGVFNASTAQYFVDNFIAVNLTETFGKGNEPTVEQMDAYLADKPFITNMEDVRAEADKLTLPEGYRPAPVAAKQKTAQLTLTTQYPEYDVRVVTDYGDDATVIEIPSNVYKFEAWVEIHTASGLLQNPQNYFDIDWGNDVNGNPQKGQKITVFSELLGLGIYNLEPTVTERVLNTSIMGKQTVVGARILHLSEYADERPIPFNLKGLTATNLVENGDFRNGTTGWLSSASTNLVTNGTLTNTGNGGVSEPNAYGEIGNKIVGNKYYLRANVTAKSALCTKIRIGSTDFAQSIDSPIVNNPYLLSGVITASTTYPYIAAYHLYASAANANGGAIEVGNVIAINLTPTFGAGNEPTKEWCDEYFSDYFEGTQSVDAPVRVKSVGKNLFDKDKHTIVQGDWNNLTGTFSALGGTSITRQPISIKGGEAYALSYNGGGVMPSPLVKVWTKDMEFVSQSSGIFRLILPPSSSYITVQWNTLSKTAEAYEGVMNTFQVERAETPSSYEPYIESNLYIDNNTKLRSLPKGVKDEIRSDGKGGYEMVKRVSDENVFNGSEIWRKYNDALNVYGFYFSELNPDAKHGGSVFANYTQNISSGITSSDSEVNWIEGENLYIKINKPKLADSSVDSWKAYLALNPLIIQYELATPIITPLVTSGSLISRPNGTVYVENVVANAGVYTDKFSVMDVDLEIKALESIAKIDYETGEATQLDVSKAVLGDTFFTHPDLEDKDIVYVNYVYKHSNVYGEASVEYYNVID